jgi:ubiquinone/menaquinone biosynthesis C-methylase UbiE
MEWHRRYLQQAQWTRDLRAYIFKKTGFNDTSLVLEVGCGTGAILTEFPHRPFLHGLDIDFAALTQCHIHAPTVSLVQGDALRLPYSNQIFDIVYCHFLLLWVRDPLQALFEMTRVTKAGAYVIAFAEPDYKARVDQPQALIPLGKWQTESLQRQGADPSLGARLADLFFRAGIKLNETGPIQNAVQNLSPKEWETEWAVLESDLDGVIPKEEIYRMKDLDQQAWTRGERVLNVPTYFAWGHT